jgi:DNA end-binding protein Ku
LTFGLVSFPVRLYRAARAEKVSFRRLYRPAAPEPSQLVVERDEEDSTPTPPVSTRKGVSAPAAAPAPEPEPAAPAPVFRTRNTVMAGGSEDEPVSPEQLVKGYEYEKGQYVVLEDEELKSIHPSTSKEMQIVEFVRMAEIDPIYLETSYYVSPDEAGERPYTLLFAALRETGYVGLAQVAMHSREHVVVLRTGSSGLIAHTMFYPDEVRKTEEFRTNPSGLNAKELNLAKRLIESMMVPFEPEKFRDTYRERLQEMIDRKMAGRQVARQSAAPHRTAEVVDIMKALQQSLDAIKKPAAHAAPPVRKPKTRKAG